MSIKITAIKAYPLGAMLDEPFAYSQRWFQGRSGLLVRISTDQGMVPLSNFVTREAAPRVGNLYRSDGRRVLRVIAGAAALAGRSETCRFTDPTEAEDSR